MIRRDIEIQNKLGLHARAASKFVATASEFAADIEVISPHATANGKSIMNVLMLQAGVNTTITLIANGEDEADAITALTELINNKFDEAE